MQKKKHYAAKINRANISYVKKATRKFPDLQYFTVIHKWNI